MTDPLAERLFVAGKRAVYGTATDYPRWDDWKDAEDGVEYRAVAAEARAFFAEEREACAKLIPTSWLDPLLSGPTKVLGLPPWNCSDIERLLKALAAAIRGRVK